MSHGVENFRAADLARVPGLLSLSRIALAVAFPFVLRSPTLALLVLFAAAASDIADGWYARHFGQVTRAGAIIDPITDKIFVLTVVITLVVRGLLSPLSVLLLSTRELGELPLVVWFLASRHDRSGESANVPGKLATVLQFLTLAAATAGLEHLEIALAASAISGALAAVLYWMRALRSATV